MLLVALSSLFQIGFVGIPWTWMEGIIQGSAAIFQVPEELVSSIISPLWDPYPPCLRRGKVINTFDTDHNDVSTLMDIGWSSQPEPASPALCSDVNDSDDDSVSAASPNSFTYGEITDLGTRQLLYHMGLTSPRKGATQKSRRKQRIANYTGTFVANKQGNGCGQDEIVFVDLGSGEGKLVVQAFLELRQHLLYDGSSDCQTKLEPSIKSAGVELDAIRHHIATTALDRISAYLAKIQNEKLFYPQSTHNVNDYIGDSSSSKASKGIHSIRNRIHIINDDLLHFDLERIGTTHIYLSSLCFSDGMMKQLAHDLLQSSRRPERLTCIATLKPFPVDNTIFKLNTRQSLHNAAPNEQHGQTAIIHVEERFVEMSWTRSQPWWRRITSGAGGCKVYIYHFL